MKNSDLKWPYNFLAEINKRIDAHDKLPECEDDAPEDIEEVLEYIFARMRHSTTKCRVLGSTFVQEHYRFGSSMQDIAVEFGITRSCVSAYICKAIEFIGGCETYRAMIRLGISYNFFHNFKRVRDEAYTLGYDHGYAAGHHSVIIAKEPLSRNSDIENCDFSTRTYIALKRNGINTIEDLLSTDDKTLMSFRNLGKKCLEEIHEFIDGYKTDAAIHSFEMKDNYPTTPVVNLTLYKGWGGGSRKAMGVFTGVIIPKTMDLSGLKFDNVIEPVNSGADMYRIIAKVLEKRKGHFIYDILKYDTHLGYDSYAIANMTMNPMRYADLGEKELVGRFMTTDCLEEEFAMDFDGDFVQILNDGPIQQMLELDDREVKKDEES